jgi:fused signal recognition particle receptor
MFKKLKDKLKNWTKKVSKETLEEKKEEIWERKKSVTQNISKKFPKKNNSSKETSKHTLKKIHTGDPAKDTNNLNPKVKAISQKEFEKYQEELELLLLENNVALEVTDKIIEKMKNEIIEKKFKKKNLETEIRKRLKEIISEILIKPFNIIEKIKKENKPYIILFCGINGVGKTTTIAKIANLLKKKKISSVIAAGDTFRAASIEQLKKHGEKLDINIISSNYGADPASVGFDAIKHAEKNKIDCVLIDTAGRMHTDKNLISQLQKISRVCKPNLKLFVGESITGNDIIEQVKTFSEAIEIDGIILCKADIDEKGGTAISVGEITKKPIIFLGTGQEYQNLEIFDKEKFIEKLGL